MNFDALRQILVAHHQDHLLAFWDELSEPARQSLVRQVEEIDLPLIARLHAKRDEQSDVRALLERAIPPQAIRLDASRNPYSPAEARQRGEQSLRQGEVGVVLVAGGQGTRLGFDHPKGMFPIGPISRRTLFQIHVEKIVAAGLRYGVRIPFYLMTSPATHEETVAFFAEHDRLGLRADDLFVFCQGTMPAVDAATGKILLETKDRIAVSPDGHGGMLRALDRSGALQQMSERGIRRLFYFQVDNPLVAICDPEFLGYHLLSGSEMTTQVVAKEDPLDRVGNVVSVDGRTVVVEYSDLPDDVARQREPDGSLRIWAGSIAVHGIEVSLLERCARDAESLPFHIARKTVACVDETGAAVKPAEPNAIKFERFIFDLIPRAENALVVEIDPAEGFAPLKNAPGAPRDTAEWVQQQMIAQHRRWLEAADVRVAERVPVEISPLWALDAAEVREKVVPETRVSEPVYFA
ncbi:MAG: UTP--glucose-1-phosphate uridylyltransferase [Planctomycetota bacterium]